jgi:uncharacterized coiled-coil DUF342 family protein
MKIFSKKLQIFLSIKKKEVVVLHPLESHASDKRDEKDTHVRRHIELTAALRDVRAKESNRIERLKNEPIDLQSKIKENLFANIR